MAYTKEIPCLTCKSWSTKHKKLFCNPKECRTVEEWLTVNIPKLSSKATMQAEVPKTAKQYVV